jgi:hypothetical protein
MKWYLLYMMSVSSTIMKVFTCRCNKVEEKMQRFIDYVENNKTHVIHYKSHSLTYNFALRECIAVVAFESPILIHYS